MFEINDPTGKKQFDIEMFAYRFVKKGSFTTATVGDGSFVLYEGNIGWGDNAGPYDLVAFACDTTFVTLNNALFDRIDGNKAYAATHRNSTDNATVYWWAFRSMRHFAPSAHGTGVQILKGDGTLIYENTVVPLKVAKKVDVASIGVSGLHLGYNGPVALTVNGSGTLPSGRQHAFIPFGTVVNGDNALGVRRTSSGYEYGPVYGRRSGARQLFNGGFLAVDVTGY